MVQISEKWVKIGWNGAVGERLQPNTSEGGRRWVLELKNTFKMAADGQEKSKNEWEWLKISKKVENRWRYYKMSRVELKWDREHVIGFWDVT
jgi:hypothetical protein